MTRTLLILATASILATGCGRAALQEAASAPASALEAPDARTALPVLKDLPEAAKAEPIDDAALTAAAPPSGARAPGDFVVYRFTGSFRKAPLTLTEKVVARSGAVLTIDFAATEGHATQELRVRIAESSPTRNEGVS